MNNHVSRSLAGLHGRRRTYGGLLAPVVGLLVLGLLIPFLAGEPTGRVTSGAGGTGSGLGVLGAEQTDGTIGAGSAVSGSDAFDPAGGPVEAPLGAAGAVGVDGQPVAKAPGSPGAVADAPGAAGQPGPVGQLGPSDVGVTAEAIRVAVLVPNLGGFGGAGFAVDLGDSRASFGAFFEELNSAGGINGRKVVASYIDFDPLNDSSMRAACLQATEDQRVFATFNVNGFYGPGILCVAEEHRTPLIQAYYSDPDAWYQRSDGLYITAFPSKDRALRNLVAEMHARGALRGRKIGIVDSDYPFDKAASEQTLIPALRERGYEITHRATLSSDTATSQSQIPLEVQRMQAAGVDTIFFAAYFVYTTTWVQQASNRQYFPQYLQSDFANGTADGATDQMPPSYDGTIGVTSTRVGEHRVGRAATPEVTACLDRWKALTGAPLEPQSGDEAIMFGACGSVDTFAAAARTAGAELTRTRLRDGFTSLGQIAFPQLAPFSWRPGKTDGGDQIRLVQWHQDFDGQECRCWVPVDEFRAAGG